MSWEVQTAVLAQLRSDAALSAVLDGGKVYKSAPQDAEHPHVELGTDSDFSTGPHCLNGYRCLVEVRVWTLIEQGAGQRGPKQAQEICRAVQKALHQVDITPQNSSQTDLEWQSTVIDQSADGKSFLGIVQFETLVQSTAA